MTPEQKARVSIDVLLQQPGWHVCNVANANLPRPKDHGPETLAKAFAANS